MKMLRSRVLGLLLRVFVCFGLASSALAHRMPDAAGRALQVLQAAGIPVAALCGHPNDKAPCPDAFCSVCPGGTAALGVGPLTLMPVLLARRLVVVLPEGETPVGMRLLLGHWSRGPPPVLN